MDGQRFDDLTRALVSGASRRRVLAGLTGGLAAAVGLGARRVGAQNGCGEVDDACFGDFDCCDGACFIPQGRRRGKCVCPADTIECRGVCCTGEQICGDAVTGEFPDLNERQGCCLPPGTIVEAGCSEETVFQCCDLAPDSGQVFLCCETDQTTGVGTCCDLTAATASASSNRIIVRG